MPHLKALVERHENDNFELIGINTGDDPKTYDKGLDEHGVTWMSAYQGKESPIAALFGVTGYPTYLVLDAEGNIAYRGHRGTDIDAVVEELLAKGEGK